MTVWLIKIYMGIDKGWKVLPKSYESKRHALKEAHKMFDTSGILFDVFKGE